MLTCGHASCKSIASFCTPLPTVTNWDLMEKVWEHAVEARLKVRLSDYPILISEKPFNPSKDRLRYTVSDRTPQRCRILYIMSKGGRVSSYSTAPQPTLNESHAHSGREKKMQRASCCVRRDLCMCPRLVVTLIYAFSRMSC